MLDAPKSSETHIERAWFPSNSKWCLLVHLYTIARQPTRYVKEIGKGMSQDLWNSLRWWSSTAINLIPNLQIASCCFSSSFPSPRKHIVDLLQPKGPLCITSHINRPVLLASPGCLRWVATSASTYSSVTNLTTWQMTSSSKERMGTCLSKHRVEGLGSAEDHHHWRKVMQCWMSCPKWQVCQVCKMQRDVKNASDGGRVQIQNLSEFHWEKRGQWQRTSKKLRHTFFHRTRCLNQPCGEGRKSEYYFPAHATQPFQSPRAAQTILRFVPSWKQWKTASKPSKIVAF